jgi:23S rRNA (uracil1939-C5)-methyltransferase
MSRARRPTEPTVATVFIEALAFGGAGIARVEGKVWFVPGALPGEQVTVEILGRRRKFDQARLLEVLEPSPLRRAPCCPHVDHCGGCSLQALAYPAQLEAKAQQVRDCLARIGGMEVPEFGPPVASPDEFRYRNKMEFTFSPRAWEPQGPPEFPAPGPALGLHVPGRHDAVFELENCALPSPRSIQVLTEVRAFAREHGLPAYRCREDAGLLRHLVVREGRASGDLLVALVVRETDPVFRQLGPRLAAAVPGLTGLVLIVNRTRATIARGSQDEVLWGHPILRERLAGLSFELGAQSFFQTNTAGAEKLLAVIGEVLDRFGYPARSGAGATGAPAAPAPAPHLLDLYCGAGTLGLCLADRFAQVTGIEQVDEAIRSAERTAALNGIPHARFEVADVERWVRDFGAGNAPPDVIIVDPPRAGLHPRALSALPGLGAQLIVYVSCNPATLARDAAGLVGAGYQPAGLRIVDLFPQTGHIESVLALRRPLGDPAAGET